MARSITVREARTRFSALLAEAMGGETITITRNGHPVARLLPIERKGKRRPGSLRGQNRIAQDFDSLPDELLDQFEGRDHN